MSPSASDLDQHAPEGSAELETSPGAASQQSQPLVAFGDTSASEITTPSPESDKPEPLAPVPASVWVPAPVWAPAPALSEVGHSRWYAPSPILRVEASPAIVRKIHYVDGKEYHMEILVDGRQEKEDMWKIVPKPGHGEPYHVYLPDVTAIIKEYAKPFNPKTWKKGMSRTEKQHNYDMVALEAGAHEELSPWHVCILKDGSWFYLEHRASPEQKDWLFHFRLRVAGPECWAVEIPTGAVSWYEHNKLASCYRSQRLANGWNDWPGPIFAMPNLVPTPGPQHNSPEYLHRFKSFGWAPRYWHGGFMGYENPTNRPRVSAPRAEHLH